MMNDDVDILEAIRNLIDKRHEYKDGRMWDFEVIEDVFKRLDDAYTELAAQDVEIAALKVELAELQADNARLRLVESAARDVITHCYGTNGGLFKIDDTWTDALAEALNTLKGES